MTQSMNEKRDGRRGDRPKEVGRGRVTSPGLVFREGIPPKGTGRMGRTGVEVVCRRQYRG